jgi:hypothetical protein
MQKNLYLVIVFIFAGLVSEAQITKGSLLLGGNISFSSQNEAQPQGSAYTPQSSVFFISPTIGKAIKDNLVAGFGLNWQHAQSNEDDGLGGIAKVTTDIFGLGFFLREYTPLSTRFSFFVQEGLGGNFDTGAAQDTTTFTQYGVTLSLNPGIAYKASRKVQLEITFQDLFSFDYQHDKTGSYTSNSFSGGVSTPNLQNVSLGFKFLLGS